jgi:prepilin-type N-terminal cleavage/methylation domain-containing protein
MPDCRRIAGFSLLELLIVVALVGILAAIALPSAQPAAVEQLRSTARIMAADLALARGLAVANNSKYRVTFQFSENRYVIEHSGTNTALNQLPRSPFAARNDPTNKYIVDLDELPRVGALVRLIAAGASSTPVANVEFGPLGETTRAEPTKIWLTTGSGASARYITLEINPVTGNVVAGTCSGEPPPAAVMPSP